MVKFSGDIDLVIYEPRQIYIAKVPYPDIIISLLLQRYIMELSDSNVLLKGKLSDSFTNYNNVGNTKVSVSIKKLKPTNAH